MATQMTLVIIALLTHIKNLEGLTYTKMIPPKKFTGGGDIFCFDLSLTKSMIIFCPHYNLFLIGKRSQTVSMTRDSGFPKNSVSLRTTYPNHCRRKNPTTH